jgi:hypothetical protein
MEPMNVQDGIYFTLFQNFKINLSSIEKLGNTHLKQRRFSAILNILP